MFFYQKLAIYAIVLCMHLLNEAADTLYMFRHEFPNTWQLTPIIRVDYQANLAGSRGHKGEMLRVCPYVYCIAHHLSTWSILSSWKNYYLKL